MAVESAPARAFYYCISKFPVRALQSVNLVHSGGSAAFIAYLEQNVVFLGLK
jgi:hypothetical protein